MVVSLLHAQIVIFLLDLCGTLEKAMWICKPTGANQGKGIFLVRDLQQVLTCLERDRVSSKQHVARIVQRYFFSMSFYYHLQFYYSYRYISNPLLLQGRKFDLRVYMLVAWGKQWVVLFRQGYVRLCCQRYEAGSTDLTVHLTNQFQQKKSPLYSQLKDDTVSCIVQIVAKLGVTIDQQVWDFEKFQDNISAEYSLPQDWVATTLTVSIT